MWWKKQSFWAGAQQVHMPGIAQRPCASTCEAVVPGHAQASAAHLMVHQRALMAANADQRCRNMPNVASSVRGSHIYRTQRSASLRQVYVRRLGPDATMQLPSAPWQILAVQVGGPCGRGCTGRWRLPQSVGAHCWPAGPSPSAPLQSAGQHNNQAIASHSSWGLRHATIVWQL